MKISADITFEDLFKLFKNNEISQRSFITFIKQRTYLQDAVNKKTIFLDIYEPDILDG